MSDEKQAGRFSARVRDDGWPIWIDFKWDTRAGYGDSESLLTVEQLRDLVYVATSALRIAEKAEAKQP